MSAPESTLGGISESMTPERWRAIDALLQAVLERAPERRDAFIAESCRGDEGLRDEVVSLLAAHDRVDDEFLERPAAEALGVTSTRRSVVERLASALSGRYAIDREIARGGMATVYLARDLRHERHVAIKVLHEELAAAVGADRFLAEIRVTASLQHPHILPLFDSGSVPGATSEQPTLLYYVMPFVDGETLRSRLTRDRRLPVDTATQIAREVAEALEYAHQQGVVHRDVKPENVLLQGGHALVGDFGIALAIQEAGGDRLTRTGIRIGTPQYMAPEQASGERDIDARADVYALGVVLQEMLVGESRFAVAPRRADVPSFLDAVVQRAMAKRPEDRFESTAAFASALTAPVIPDAAAPDVPAVPPNGTGEAAATKSSSGRTVSARAALYAMLATLIFGVGGGWALARSSIWEKWKNNPSPQAWPPAGIPTIERPPAKTGDVSLAIVDRAGRSQRVISANRPWTPRFSSNGRFLAYGAFGEGRETSDIWILDLDQGTTKRLTDDEADSNDPQWSPDGSEISYSVNATGGKDLMAQRLGGGARLVGPRWGTQFASDWLRDGSALVVTDQTSNNGYDIIVQPVNGSEARPYATTPANETAGRVSPDGKWIAFTSDESGQDQVYLDSYPTPTRRVLVSSGTGLHPVWRGDGKELYYWSDSTLIAVALGTSWGNAPPAIGASTKLFRASYRGQPNTMYDVSPDGQRFAIVQQP